MPKIKVLSRNPDDYVRETKRDIHKGELNAKYSYYRYSNMIHAMDPCVDFEHRSITSKFVTPTAPLCIDNG